MFSFPMPTAVSGVDAIGNDYFLCRFGEHPGPFVLVTVRKGKVTDSFLVVNGSIIGLPLYPTVD